MTTAWGQALNQNVSLRIVVICLSLTTVLATVGAIKLSVKKPLVIERSCFTSVRGSVTDERSPEEIKTFMRLAILKRFNSTSDGGFNFLSRDQLVLREKEQEELNRKKMRQNIVIHSVALSGEEIRVFADRLIGVGKIRSAFSYPLKVEIKSVSRSESNPYGLLLTKVEELKVKESEDDEI